MKALQDVVAGVDAGTSGCKVTILASNGIVLATQYRPYRTYHQHEGWAEQDPDDWVAAAHGALRDALREASSGEAIRLRSLAFSAPHHVLVLLDQQGKPIRRAIMWTDQRSAGVASELASSDGEAIWRKCGNMPAATWTLPQLIWLQRSEPRVLRLVRSTMTMKDYVRRSFCQAYVTDHVDAAGTLLYDITTRRWDPQLLELAGLSIDVMPRLVEPTSVVGHVDRSTGEELGLPRDCRVLAGSSDTSVELVAAGCVEPGDHTLKLATAGNVSRVSASPSPTPDSITYPFLVPGTYYLNSATNSAAASYEWFARLFTGGIASDDTIRGQLEAEAAAVPPGCDGVTFHPYLTGERAPHWNGALRGSFVGLAAGHGRGHLARAVMEGVAMSLRDARGAGAQPLATATLIGGGAKSAVWSQIVANVMRTDLWVPAVADSSLGGAVLAGLEQGWLSELREARHFLPQHGAARQHDPVNSDLYDEVFQPYQRIQRALAPGYDADYSNKTSDGK